MSELQLPTGTDDRPEEYRADVSFDDMGLSPELRKAVAERGYTHPTPVQARAFSPARAGKDLIVRSKTGTGKTAAFGMPILDQIPVGARGVKALMMCPTRELALQVAAELTTLAKYRDVEVVCIYGGASMQQQEDALRRGAAIVVGTPGRVFDHIRRGNLKLDQCVHAVLDEADEMLNQGFYEEVTRILDHLPKKRQVLLFSATVPEDIRRLISKYTTEPETLLLSGDVYTVDHIRHVRYELSDAYPKPRNLLYMLEMEDPDNAIIFCNTRADTELVTVVLNRNGFDAELLNGDLPQKERERVMARVKRGELAFMVATDIAARGIDISDLGHVINYSLPEDPAVYLHRVGRTGRIGKKGTALNLTSGRELATLTALEKKYNVTFERKPMPTKEEAEAMWSERHVGELKEAAKGSVYESFLALAGSLKGRGDADELIAFMLKYFFTHRRMEKAQAHEGAAPAETSAPEAGHVNSRGERSHAPREERPRREGSREGRRGERGDRGERRERPPREHREAREAGPSEAATAPMGTPAVAPAEGATTPAAPAAPRAAPKKRLTDREIFELMQAGKPIPPIDDPTEAAGDEAPSDRPPRRERGERRERSERSERGERGERGERRERRPKEAPVEVAPGNVRIWVSLGKADGVADDAGIASALSALGAPGDKIAKTELRGTYSYVHVAEADAGAFEALAGKQHGEKPLKVERARR
jgi:ATP-dependent RNA helicase DeaD